jgi:hypothetical protein
MAEEAEEAKEAEGKPWAEQSPLAKAGTVVGFVIVGSIWLFFALVLLALYLVLVVQGVVESRWAFTNVNPERVCAPSQRHDCLIRMPGRVSSEDGLTFTVGVDRRPYSYSLDTVPGTPPSAGSRVVVETWNGRLVSIVEPQRGRRRAEEWPRKWHDLSEGVAALVVVFGVPGIIIWTWVVGRRDKKRALVSGQPARTS